MIRIEFLFFTSLLLFTSCSTETKEKASVPTSDNELTTNLTKEEVLKTVEKDRKNRCIDSVLFINNLVDIQSVDSSIQVELRYASTNNFMKQKLYFTLNKLYLQKDVAERLSKSQQYLKTLHPGYSLLVYDGARPVAVQQRMWDALDTIPVSERGKFVSNPKNHSVHNYGAAIDLTIVDENNRPLDMGAGYDDIRKIAYPSLEAQFLASGELQVFQVENRALLRKVMKHQGFINIPSEWWHFNAYTRNEVKRRYQVLMEEPKCE